MSTPRFSPHELSEALGEPFAPTEQQAEIISAPLEPMLVIAGAGSGKTKTMADKVVWLVANGLVRPEEVLGVTFTRKAAGELSARIRQKIAKLVETGLLDGELTAEFLDPAVSTYHSYANSLVKDYGLRLGLEDDTVLLGAAQSWQLAHEVLETYTGDYQHLTSASSTLIDAIVSFSSEASEHLVTADEAETWIRDLLARISALPMQIDKDKAPTLDARKLIDRLASRATIAELSGRYAQLKRERGVMDYGDLVAHAAQIAMHVPVAATTERAKYKVVLLDEFQDTSHAQLKLFSSLFGDGHPVTAVGDPNQSIYGFRGASAGQLFHFPSTFPVVENEQRRNAHVRHLTVAWRNSVNILETANRITGSAQEQRNGPVAVKPLEPSAFAGPGRVVLNRCATVHDEAERIADLFVAELEKSSGTEPLTCAVLSRNRSQLSVMAQVLGEREIPYQVVGLSGLLSTPELVDLVSTLHVLVDPLRSDKLMRLLAGARWRLGPADLMAFADWSKYLAQRRLRELNNGPSTDDETTDVARAELNDAASLIEALDFLPAAEWTSHDGRKISATGLARLQRLREELRELRLLANHDLESLIREVERTMNLDIEVAARPWVEPSKHRVHLDAFADVVREYCRNAPRAELSGFLMWLEDAAEKESGLPLPAEDTNPRAVQLLTVHASKGLEWDMVAVMTMNDGTFPGARSDRWTSGDAALPWPLRGDRADLPAWDTDQSCLKDLLDAEKRFKQAVDEHHIEEERRLAYVALTRAKHLLVCSSSVWNGSRSKPMEPSEFIEVLRPMANGPLPQAEIGQWVETEQAPEQNPNTVEPLEARWPYDPLTGPEVSGQRQRSALPYSRRTILESLAERITEQIGREPSEPTSAVGRAWRQEAETLLRHRQFLSDRERTVTPPEHVRASLFVDLAENPQEVIDNIRRPVPHRPGLAARRGTAFHAWIENYYEQTGMLDLGELVAPADRYLDEALDLEAMKNDFLASDWAQRTPAYVEVPLETRIGQVAVRGRIDAVFRNDDDSWILVDWKTGRVPRGEDLKHKLVQLAVYRLGWARLHNIPVEKIHAAFYYVAAGITIHAEQLASEHELETMVAEAFASIQAAQG